MRIREPQTLPRQTVQIRRRHLPGTITAEVPKTHVVPVNQDDVRRLGRSKGQTSQHNAQQGKKAWGTLHPPMPHHSKPDATFSCPPHRGTTPERKRLAPSRLKTNAPRVHPPAILNLSCYQFTPLSELPEWRERLRHACATQGLRGTILLAPEGINFFLSGTREQLGPVLDLIRSMPGCENVQPKESPGSHQPFNRMLVKIKREIISFGLPGIDPASRPSRKISPAQLRKWLDEGRDFTLLDTRNRYETKMGSFEQALDPGIDSFREFPAALKRLPEDALRKPLVVFCTGGIRCEKAAPFLEQSGFSEVFQLEGGILKYFEEVGGAHYRGDCFVFDARVGVDPSLNETDSVLCFQCQTPLSAAEQQDPRYEYEKSCPHCHPG